MHGCKTRELIPDETQQTFGRRHHYLPCFAERIRFTLRTKNLDSQDEAYVVRTSRASPSILKSASACFKTCSGCPTTCRMCVCAHTSSCVQYKQAGSPSMKTMQRVTDTWRASGSCSLSSTTAVSLPCRRPGLDLVWLLPSASRARVI